MFLRELLESFFVGCVKGGVQDGEKTEHGERGKSCLRFGDFGEICRD